MAENVCELIGNITCDVGRKAHMQDMLNKCLSKHVQVLPLSRSDSNESGVWCSSSSELLKEWEARGAFNNNHRKPNPLKRVFVEIPDTAKAPSFCLDLYCAGASPGFNPLGRDRDPFLFLLIILVLEYVWRVILHSHFCSGVGEGSAVAILYRVEYGQISHIWCGHDHDLSSMSIDEDAMIDSKLFLGDVLEVS
jgi:hypothetical protein